MSIWISWQHIGTDPTVMYEVEPGLHEVDLGDGKQARGRQPVEQKPEGGNVLSYADGWSNHFPDLTGECERPAVVAVASIPSWCVPGHRGDDADEFGQWLRLEVAAPETLNFWQKDAEGNPAVEEQGATVVLDRQAVQTLRDQLNVWLERATVEPIDKAHAKA
jgi:hypothetical protein